MVAERELEMMITREIPDSSSHTPKRKTQIEIEFSGNCNDFSSSGKDKLKTSIDKQIEATIKKMSKENQESMSQCGTDNYVPNEASHTSQSNSRGPTHESSNSYDVWNYANVFFATEKINLPRDKVIEV